MSVPAVVRPNRGLVFPFFVAFFPMIWFVYRETPVRVVDGKQVMTSLSRTLTLAILAVIMSYAIAVIVVLVFVPRDEPIPSWQGVLFRPTNDTLVVLVVLNLLFVAYVATNTIVNLPYWSELVIGIPLLWPLFAAMLVTFAVGNAVPVLQTFSVQAGFTVVGLALSAVWVFILSTGFARVLFPAE